jgi:ribosomal protein S18 acetylase RimI-like enzyme
MKAAALVLGEGTRADPLWVRRIADAMAVYLRRATPADATAVLVLVRAAYAKWVSVLGREPLPMLADYNRAICNHIVDLLFLDECLTGVIELVVEPRWILIENVAVRPDQAGRGHGRALMAHAAEVAGTMGLKRLRLYTNSLMAENITLYRRLGYAIDREETTPDGRRIVHMSMLI